MNGPIPEARGAQPIPGSETCGCCDGIEPSTPKRNYNRHGLSLVGYRIGEYHDFHETLHARLSSNAFAPIDRLLTRERDDFTIALLDAFSCAADVLTFYQERIANESYLNSATERVSLQELGKLIGYKLRPGIAAETQLAFALEKPPVPPANLPPDPGAFVTGVPAAITLPVGVKVQHVPGPDEKPQTFETVEAIDARPEWNAIRPWLADVLYPRRGETFTYLAGVRNNLKAGDAIVFLGAEYLAASASNDNWDFRVIDKVVLEPEHDRTRVEWKRGLGSMSPFSAPAAQPEVHALRKRAAVFGHNAPLWGAMPKQFRDDYEAATDTGGFTTIAIGGTGGASLVGGGGLIGGGGIGGIVPQPLVEDWPRFTISPLDGHVDLDTVYGEVTPGGYAVLARGAFNYPAEPEPPNTYVELYRVETVAEVSRAEFALSGNSTRLQLAGENYSQFSSRVRQTRAFVQSEPLAFAAYPVTTAVSGDDIPLDVAAEGLEAGRRLIVRGTRVGDGVTIVHSATLVQAVAQGTARCITTITPPLPAPLVRSSVVVHANVALASHGETVSQVLGAGDASAKHQRFELKQLPLTYRAAANESGAAAELSVRVGDIEWSERASLFGAAPTERTYALQRDEHDRAWLQFGDGARGARLPSGVNNVRATYRKGLGAAGNVGAESLTQLGIRPLGVNSVANPLPAEGGTDAEAPDAARRTLPLGTRTLGRAVSLLDYEDFARAFGGIAKAQARVLQLAAGPTIAITVAGDGNVPLSATNPTMVNLLAALKASGDPHVPVQLLAHQASTFRLALKVKRDPAYELDALLAAVEAELRSRFAFDARELAQPVHPSDVIATVHAVPGVVAVDLDLLYGGTSPVVQTLPARHTRLLASRMRVAGGVALAAEILTLDPGPLHHLVEMT